MNVLEMLRDAGRWLGFLFALAGFACVALVLWIVSRCFGAHERRAADRFCGAVGHAGRVPVARTPPGARGYAAPRAALGPVTRPAPPQVSVLAAKGQTLHVFPGYAVWDAADGEDLAQWN